MANQKISQLTEDTSADPSDILYGTDASGTVDKRFSVSTLRGGELAVEDQEELNVVTVGTTTTLSIEDAIARRAEFRPKIIGDYYTPVPGPKQTGTVTLNREIHLPVYLRAGVLDRIGVECTTAVASAVARLGVREDDGNGDPGDLIAEASSQATLHTSTGWKIVDISATLPLTGRYHLVLCGQTAAGTVRTLSAGDSLAPVNLGSSSPGVTTASVLTTHVAGQTGALTSTVGTLVKGSNTLAPLFVIRYSA